MRASTTPMLRRLAGAAAASGLALAGLVAAAAPASAAACSGTSGVTVVVDTGSSLSTRCASGDPGSAMQALKGAGFTVTYPQQYPGSVVCRIDGYPASDPCRAMPPADAYWAFFHAERGGSWVYSSSGAASYDPAPGTVVGFRFGSGQQPRVAPPAPTTTATSKPAPTTTSTPRATSTPRKTTTAPKPTTATPQGSTKATTGTTARPTPAAPPSGRPTASASTAPTASASGTASASAAPTTTDGEPTTVAAAPTSQPAGGSGPGTLLAGGALVALVAGGAGFAAWKRRG